MAKIVELPIGAVPTDSALTVIHQAGDTRKLTIANLRTAMLTPATTEKLGAVSVGSGLTVTSQGVLSAIPATSTTLGSVRPGTTLSITNGVLDYFLPVASETHYGGVKVGYGLGVDENDALNITLTVFDGDVTGALTGSVYSTDSELMVDAVGGVITAPLQYADASITNPEPGKISIFGETSFDGPAVFKSYTEIQRDALTAQVGMVIFNTDAVKLQVWVGNAWINLH